MRYFILLPLLGLAACASGPDYHRPDIKLPQHFSEAGAEWRPAQAAGARVPETWWRVFDDPELDRLEARVTVDNQTLKAAEAQYRVARAAYDSARANRFPFVTANAAASRGHNAGVTANAFSVGVAASWEPDLWNRLRLAVDAAGARADASAADLAAARLSTQLLLAQTWFQLRANAQQVDSLQQTLAAVTRFLNLTRDRLDAGVASSLDVSQAEAQVANARAQLHEFELQRAQLAHALASLLGDPGMALPATATGTLPEVPPAPQLLPSTMLEWRPDITAAERRVAAANAEVGIAQAAWYPVLDLAAVAGQRASVLSELFSAPSRLWSLGPSIAMTLFDGGARSAALEQARASHELAEAVYRQTVLNAFQEVEDNLAAARLLAREEGDQTLALSAARRARAIADEQYRAGTVSALNVVVSQVAEYLAARAVTDIRYRRIDAELQLLKTAGGKFGAPDTD